MHFTRTMTYFLLLIASMENANRWHAYIAYVEVEANMSVFVGVITHLNYFRILNKMFSRKDEMLSSKVEIYVITFMNRTCVRRHDNIDLPWILDTHSTHMITILSAANKGTRMHHCSAFILISSSCCDIALIQVMPSNSYVSFPFNVKLLCWFIFIDFFFVEIHDVSITYDNFSKSTSELVFLTS